MASIKERLQKAFNEGRRSSGDQVWDALLAMSDAMKEHDPASAAAFKYGAELANNISCQEAEYDEDV